MVLRILDQVNFDASRVRPNFSLDAAAGATVISQGRKREHLAHG